MISFLVVKTFSLRMCYAGVRIFLSTYHSVVTVSLQCFMRKAWFRCFSSFLLITHLITLSLEKIVIVFEKIWKRC